MLQRLTISLLLILSSSLLLTGCGADNDPNSLVSRANKDNIQRLGNLYGSYQSRHGWVGPKDKETFVEFIQSFHESKLERMGVDPTDIEGLFLSPRDNEEFKIRYSVKGGMGASAPVIFEVTGVDGLRKVAFTAMRNEEADTERYDLLWSGEADNTAPVRNVQPPTP